VKDTSIFILVSWSLIVVFYDIFTRTIPNFMSIGALLLALLVLAITGLSVTHQPASSALVGFVLAMVMTVPGYIFKVLGGGDVKLLCAIGLLCGVKIMLSTFAVAALSVAMLWMLWTKLQWLDQILPLNLNISATRTLKEKNIPFGAALGAGLILILLLPDLFNLTWGFNLNKH
jgi:prepilin peptidase CpaA